MTGALPEGWLVLEGTSDPPPPVDRTALRAVLACKGTPMASSVHKTTIATSKKPRPAAREKPDAVPQEVKSFPEIHALWVDVATAEKIGRDASLVEVADAVLFYNSVVSQIRDAVPESMKNQVEKLKAEPIPVDKSRRPPRHFLTPSASDFHLLRGILHKHAILGKK